MVDKGEEKAILTFALHSDSPLYSGKPPINQLLQRRFVFAKAPPPHHVSRVCNVLFVFPFKNDLDKNPCCSQALPLLILFSLLCKLRTFFCESHLEEAGSSLDLFKKVGCLVEHHSFPPFSCKLNFLFVSWRSLANKIFFSRLGRVGMDRVKATIIACVLEAFFVI